MMSGGRVSGFRSGWALPIFGFGKAHYFQRSGAGKVISLCHRKTGFAGRLFDAGNFKRCKLCEQAIKNHGIRAEAH